MKIEIEAASWQDQAAEKRTNTLVKIRPQWKLGEEDLRRAAEQRDLTGPFIQSLLEPAEVSITSLDSLSILNRIRRGASRVLK